MDTVGMFPTLRGGRCRPLSPAKLARERGAAERARHSAEPGFWPYFYVGKINHTKNRVIPKIMRSTS